MKIVKDDIIGELVAENYRYASVFKKAGIDFCCNGNRSIASACEDKEIDAGSLINELNKANLKDDNSGADFNAWPLDLLIDYIEKKHHRYVEQRIPEILPFLKKVASVHGSRHPELYEILDLFTASAGDLTMHMKKEEMILFPYVRKMLKSDTVTSAPFGTVQNPISMMMHEHDNEGQRFRKIAELSNDYTLPSDACNTFKVTYALLQEFEEDLHMHIHLENNILFPKAVEMEQQTLV